MTQIDNLIDDALLKALLDSCARNEIRLQKEADVVSWARGIILRHSILDSIRKGNVEVYDVVDSEPLFRITPRGAQILAAHHAAVERLKHEPKIVS